MIFIVWSPSIYGFQRSAVQLTGVAEGVSFSNSGQGIHLEDASQVWHHQEAVPASYHYGKLALILAVILFLGEGSKCFAQSGNASVERIDCNAFQLQKDGKWTATRETTLVIGGNSIAVPATTPEGSVNGLDIQGEIGLKCGKIVPLPKFREGHNG